MRVIWSGDAGGQTCEACVVEGVNSSQDLFDARAETTYASDAVILLTELRLDGKGKKMNARARPFLHGVWHPMEQEDQERLERDEQQAGRR